MRPFGLVRTSPAASGGSLNIMARRYGVTDPTIAAQWGYHLTPDQGTAQRTATGPAMSPAEMLVLTGNSGGAGSSPASSYHGIPVPPGGCAAEAATRLGLGGDDPLGGSLVSTIDANAYAQSKTDARVTAVFSAWSACMRGKGFSYATPLAPAASFDLTSPERSKKELQTAAADVSCQAEHNVIGVWFTVDSAFEIVLIGQQTRALAAIRQRIDDVLRKASAIAAGKPRP
jgi:hypothetical protein